MNYYALLSISASFICVLVGTHAYAQDPNKRLSKMFLVLTLLEAYLALAEYGLRMARDFETALFWFKFGFLWPLPVACSLHFALILARKYRLLHSKRTMIFLYLPAWLFSLLHFMPDHFYGLPTRTYWGWAYRNSAATTSIVYKLCFLWVISSIIWGMYICVRHFLKAPSYRAKQRVKFILFGFLILFIVDSISELVLPAFSIVSPELASLGVLLANIFVGYGIWKYRLFTLTPEAAAKDIISAAMNALLLVEPGGRVVLTNRAASGLFKREESQLTNSLLSSFFVTEDSSPLPSDRLSGQPDGNDRLPEYETTLVVDEEKTTPVSISAFNLNQIDGSLLGHVIIISDITLRREAEKALRESEEKFRSLVETTSDWIWMTDQNHAYIYSSPMVKDLLGYELSEIIGKTPVDFITISELERNITTYEKITRDNEPFYDFENIKTHKDGHEVILESSGIPVFDSEGGFKGYRGISRDITKRKAFEKGRLQAWKMLQLVMDNIPQSIFWKDRNCSYLGCNKNFAEDAGICEPAAIVGKTDYDLPWKKEEADFYVESDNRVMATDTPQLNIMESQLQASGKQAVLETNKIPIHNQDGEVVGMLGTYEDITERLKLVEEAKLREQQLIQADKMISLGVLVSGVAHEINNPNQFIISHISPLEKAWEGVIPILDSYHKEQGDFRVSGMNYSIFKKKMPSIFSNISEGAKRIQNIVDELKDYVREYPEQRLETIHFNSVIQSALTLVNNLINKSTQHFSVHYGENLPEIAGHYQRLEQVVINLIQNACQALSNDEESISLTTYYDKVNKTIHLEVKDEGIGISEQQLPRISDPFFTTKRDSGGLGLGLSISSSIIIEHSGHLKFMPNLKKGTLVKLSLPAIQA